MNLKIVKSDGYEQKNKHTIILFVALILNLSAFFSFLSIKII